MSIANRLLQMSFRRSDTARDAGLSTPDDVIRYDDLRYGDNPQWQVLDVYRPQAAEGRPLPVIVSVHGGGWVYGTKEVYQFYCMRLAQRGFAVVNFSIVWPRSTSSPPLWRDTDAVFHWVLDHADGYGFDTDHIFSVGDSVGANILGLYSAACTNPAYAARYAFHPPAGFAPKAVALNCGQYQVEPKILPTDLIHLLIRDYLPKRGSPYELDCIDVTAHITSGFPPVFLMTANGDFLREQ